VATQNIYTGSLSTFSYMSGSLTGYADAEIQSMSVGSALFSPNDVQSTQVDVVTLGYGTYMSCSRPDATSIKTSMSDLLYMYSSTNSTYMIHSYSAAGAITPTAAVRYKMRGWRAAVSSFEYWIASDPNASPPSGNTLIDITIAQTLR
jgi:hypothetical protein